MAERKQNKGSDPFRSSNMFYGAVPESESDKKNKYHNNNNLDIDTNMKYYSNSNNLFGGTNAENYSKNNNLFSGPDAAYNAGTGEKKQQGSSNENTVQTNYDYGEETAAEIAAPVTIDRGRIREDDETEQKAAGAAGVGLAAIILSILSLFVLPVFFGGAGIVLGFIARARGSTGLGSWAIGIGIVSLAVSLLIAPFF